MPILNYSTTISAEKTIGEIQQMLAKNGARAIMSEYDDEGLAVSLSFRIVLSSSENQEVAFRLPLDWQPVLDIMSNDRKVPNKYLTKEHAIRVSWRIVKDWIKAQMALIEIGMVKTEQVFLPYVIMPNDKTLWQNTMGNPQLLLSEQNQ